MQLQTVLFYSFIYIYIYIYIYDNFITLYLK